MSSVEAQAAATPEPPASQAAPLDLRWLRARQASSGVVRNMAGAAGAALDSGKPSAQAALATSIRESAKPDCLGPSEQGSLVAVFVIAYAAATDKCR